MANINILDELVRLNAEVREIRKDLESLREEVRRRGGGHRLDRRGEVHRLLATTQEACEILNCSRWRVRYLIQTRVLKVGPRLGKHATVTRASLDTHLRWIKAMAAR